MAKKSIAYHHSIESGASPSSGTLQIGSGGELGLEIGLHLGSSRGERRAIVEAQLCRRHCGGESG